MTLAKLDRTGAERQPPGADPAAAHRAARRAPVLARGSHPVLPAPDSPAGLEAELALATLRATGQRSAVFSRTDVAGQIAAHLPTTGLAAPQAHTRVEALTDVALKLAEAVPVGQPVRSVSPRASDARYATVEVLQAEARILSLAHRGRNGGYGQGGDWYVRIAAAATARLDDGQIWALVRLTGGGDFLSVVTAPAGAGKTSTLGATSQVTHAGYRVVGLAPSARAAAELADATGARADTLAKWLHNQDRRATAVRSTVTASWGA